MAMASERIASGDGLRLRFMPDDATLHRLTEIVLAERQCLSQLRFTLELEPNHGPAWLTIGGPPGTADFLSGLMRDRDKTPAPPASGMN